jgi:hypothetical protein
MFDFTSFCTNPGGRTVRPLTWRKTIWGNISAGPASETLLASDPGVDLTKVVQPGGKQPPPCPDRRTVAADSAWADRLGGFVAQGRCAGIGVFAAVTAAYAGSLIMFFVTDRYQLPLLVPLAMAGGAAVSHVWELRHATKRLMLPLATFVTALVVAHLKLGVDSALPEERTRMAMSLIERGDVSRAETLVSRTERDHRNPSMVHYRAGLAFAKKQEFDAAATHLRRALELNPGNVDADLLLGEVLLEAGDPFAAIPRLRRNIEDTSVPTAAVTGLVRALYATGQHEEASKTLARIGAPRRIFDVQALHGQDGGRSGRRKKHQRETREHQGVARNHPLEHLRVLHCRSFRTAGRRGWTLKISPGPVLYMQAPGLQFLQARHAECRSV